MNLKNFAKTNIDMTIGAAVATIFGSILRANDMAVGAEVEVAIGVLVVCVLARLGIKFGAPVDEANKEKDA